MGLNGKLQDRPDAPSTQPLVVLCVFGSVGGAQAGGCRKGETAEAAEASTAAGGVEGRMSGLLICEGQQKARRGRGRECKNCLV